MKINSAVLNRLLGRQIFSEACVDVLRSHLGAERLCDLCALDGYRIRAVHELAPDEKNTLVELCERLQRDLTIQPLPHLFYEPSKPQQIPFTTIPQVECAQATVWQAFQGQQMPSQATSHSDSEHAETSVVLEVVKVPAPGNKLWPEHEAKHFAGKCQPCAYYFKPDSCKWGAKCDFCHLCPEGEIKSRKKEKIRTMRDQALREKSAKEASQVVSVSLSSMLSYSQ